MAVFALTYRAKIELYLGAHVSGANSTVFTGMNFSLHFYKFSFHSFFTFNSKTSLRKTSTPGTAWLKSFESLNFERIIRVKKIKNQYITLTLIIHVEIIVHLFTLKLALPQLHQFQSILSNFQCLRLSFSNPQHFRHFYRLLSPQSSGKAGKKVQPLFRGLRHFRAF